MPYRSGSNPAELQIKSAREFISRLPTTWHHEESLYNISLAMNSFKTNRWSFSPRESLMNIKISKFRLLGIRDDNDKDFSEPISCDYEKIYSQIEKKNSELAISDSKNAEKVRKKFYVGQLVGYCFRVWKYGSILSVLICVYKNIYNWNIFSKQPPRRERRVRKARKLVLQKL